MKLKTFIMSIVTGLIVTGLTLSTIYFYIQRQETYQLLIDAQDQSIFLQDLLEKTETKLQKQIDKNSALKQELEAANQTIIDLKGTEYKLVYLGNFKLTHYCDERFSHICGGNGVTASGTKTLVGRTVAVDPKKIPYGTKIYIEGYGWRVAEDCGAAVNGNQIDILVNTHSQALSLGTKSGGVWILVKNS